MNILVVDDDQMILEFLRAGLERAGHEVLTCVNMDTAEPALQEHAFNLVITDIIMPGRDGIKLAQYVRDRYPGLPIVGITTGVENAIDDYVNMADMFMDETLSKPFDVQHMVEVVERLGQAA